MTANLLSEKAKMMSEDDLLRSVVDLARTFHWKVEHKRPARLEDGSWRTAIAGDAGGPDLLLARCGVVLTVELKSQKGKLTQEQADWKEATNGLVWRPRDWLDGTIEEILKPKAYLG